MPDLMCPNCGADYNPEDIFCASCGQKTGLGIASVWSMIVSFVSNLVNYESKLFRTTRGLFKPGFLTNEYLAIRRVDYLSPIRVFFILLFLMFFALSFVPMNFVVNDKSDPDFELDKTMMQKAMSLDSYIQQQIGELDELVKRKQKDPEKQKALSKHLNAAEELFNLNVNQTTDLTLFGNEYIFKKSDLLELDHEELIEKYEIKPILDQLVLRAMIRFSNDPKGFLKFLFSNMTWAVFIHVLLMASIFKLMHFRSRYAAHFVYQLHLHSFWFLIVMASLTIPEGDLTGWLIALMVLTALVYFFQSSYRVYGKKLWLNGLKNIILVPIYLAVLLVSIIFVMFVSSILF